MIENIIILVVVGLIVGLAGGSGITPFLSMARAIADGTEDFNLTILFGSRTEEQILFKGELAELTINFYRRNYIEGLFLSSGVLRDPDYTCEQMIETLRILREEYRFMGYIHAKAIPGADETLLNRLGHLADIGGGSGRA